MDSPEQIVVAFLRDWLAWADRGAPNNAPYAVNYGLCRGVAIYCREHSPGHAPGALAALERMFRLDGLDPTFPFGASPYFGGERRGTMHLDANRLNWVRSKCR